jgi:hypothetical protein
VIAYHGRVVRRLPLLVLASLASTMACGLFPSLDGFAGIGTGPPDEAAGSESPDGAVLTPGSDAGLPAWCATQGAHTLCADFDTPDAFAVLTRTDPTAGATSSLDSTQYTSAPFALATTTPVASGAGSADLQYDPLGHAQTGFHLAFDLRLETVSGPDGSVLVAEMIYYSASSRARYDIELDWQGGVLALAEYAEDATGTPIHGTSSWPIATQIDLDAWYGVVFDVSADVSSASVSLAKKPDAPAPVIDGVTLRPTVSDSHGQLFSLGLVWVAPNASAQRAQFDNVLFDWK